jgi:hypothetical protein
MITVQNTNQKRNTTAIVWNLPTNKQQGNTLNLSDGVLFVRYTCNGEVSDVLAAT